MADAEWVLIANATRASVYERGTGGQFRLLRSLEHPQSRQHSAQLGRDKAGRELSPSGYGGAALLPRTDLHQKEHLRFAHQLAAFAEQEAQDAAFARISIFAAEPFLGELRRELGPACKHRLQAAQGPDLSRVGIAELAARVDHALQEAQVGEGA